MCQPIDIKKYAKKSHKTAKKAKKAGLSQDINIFIMCKYTPEKTFINPIIFSAAVTASCEPVNRGIPRGKPHDMTNSRQKKDHKHGIHVRYSCVKRAIWVPVRQVLPGETLRSRCARQQRPLRKQVPGAGQVTINLEARLQHMNPG